MHKSDLVIDINAMKDMAVRASYRPQDLIDSGEMSVSLKNVKVNSTWYHDWKLLAMVSLTMRELINEDVKGRITFLVPDRIYLRCLQVMRAIKDEKDVEEIVLPWMLDNRYEVTITEDGKRANQWVLLLELFYNEYKELLRSATVNWKNARTLYKWKIEGQTKGLHNGDKLFFKAGVCEAQSVICRENPYLNGEHEVTITIDRYNGKDSYSYFVKRIINVDENGVPISETGMAIKNAIMLRSKNAEQLPRLKVAKNVTVQYVTNGLF